MPAIEAVDLYRFFHSGDAETLALRGVSLRVEAGETVAVVGPSGSGKSTLLACLAGLDDPDGGHVDILGERLTRRPEPVRARLRAERIGTILQSGNLFAHLSVADNVRLQMRLARRFDERRVWDLLDQVGLAGRGGAWPSQLSGGEVTRAGFVVAVAADPSVLLADEPTAEVDAATEDRVLDLLEARRRRGGSAVIATHGKALAGRADRIVMLHDGKVVDG